jgi:FkbM family methyltransferase
VSGILRTTQDKVVTRNMIRCILAIVFVYAVLLLGVESAARLQFKYTPPDANLIGIYRTLANLEDHYGLSISAVLDVGANSGDWANDFRLYFPNVSFFLIEGNDELTNTLQKRGFPFHIGLVGNETREVEFFRSASGGGTGNSIFREQGWKNAKSVVTKMQPIDQMVQEHHAGPFDFFKLDVQGAELLALQGAVRTMETVQTLTVEMSIMNFNHGGVLFFALLDCLKKLGFELFDVFSLMRGKGSMAVQLDGLFVRNSSPLWRHPGIDGLYPLADVERGPKVKSEKDLLLGYAASLQNLKQLCQLSIDTVVEIGAYEFSKVIQVIFPNVVLFSIEGNTQVAANKAAKKLSVDAAYVLDEEKESVVFVRNAANQFELFDPNFDLRNISRERTRVRTTTIDKVVSTKPLTGRIFLRLAIPGSEYLALQGATTLLKKAEIVGVRVTVVRSTNGENRGSLYPVSKLLTAAGFALYDVVGIYRVKSILTHIELMFVKHNSSLWNLKCTSFERPQFEL